MLKRVNRFLAALMLLGATVYIVVLNPEKHTIWLTKSWSITSYTGVILLGVFVLGFFVSFIGTILLGIRAYFRERSLIKADSLKQKFFEILVEARNYVASGELGKAQSLWERFLAKSNQRDLSALASLELAKLIDDKETKLKCIDQARASFPENTEILFYAAELNRELGNETAALDNLALIMYHHPNKRAAKLAFELALSLGKLGDAREYFERYRDLGGTSLSEEQLAEAELKASLNETDDDIKLLKNHIKAYPNSLFAREELAERFKEAGNLKEAAQYLTEIAERTKTLADFRELIELWKDDPNRAIAVAKRAKDAVQESDKGAASLELTRLYLGLGMLAEAEKEAKSLSSFEGTLPVPVHTLSSLYQASVCLKRGETSTALSYLERLVRLSKEKETIQTHQADAPKPELSTP
jgi:tetratricopeptide (TPR) repeat protein